MSESSRTPGFSYLPTALMESPIICYTGLFYTGLHPKVELSLWHSPWEPVKNVDSWATPQRQGFSMPGIQPENTHFKAPWWFCWVDRYRNRGWSTLPFSHSLMTLLLSASPTSGKVVSLSSPPGVTESSNLAESCPSHTTTPEKCQSAVKNQFETRTGHQLFWSRRICSWKHSPINVGGEGKRIN